jgi:hypothetical protein
MNSEIARGVEQRPCAANVVNVHAVAGTEIHIAYGNQLGNLWNI